MTLIPCVLVYHFLKYVVPCCFLFSRYFSQSEEYWQWFCNVTECYLCVYIYYTVIFLSMYISTYLYLSNLSQAFPRRQQHQGASSKGSQPAPRNRAVAAFPGGSQWRTPSDPFSVLKRSGSAHAWTRRRMNSSRSCTWWRFTGGGMWCLEDSIPVSWECIATWWFQIFFYFHPYLGKWSNLTSIFFRWVETTK